jgi:ABC-type multidrug transport system fused ATPase/permease subunit
LERGDLLSIVGWMIVFCEIAFWFVIILGLAIRYIFKREKLGLVFLALTPLIDLLLLITAGIDLYHGAVATQAHAIAAVYIGVSIAFGKSMIAWADQRFQYYVMKQGEKPKKLYGIEYSKHYFKSWVRHLIAYIIGAALLAGLIFWIGDATRTEALSGMLRFWSFVLVIDLVISISHFIWPRKEKVKATKLSK